jgi:hypothetical protein
LQTGYLWLMPLLLLARLMPHKKKVLAKVLTGLANTMMLFVAGAFALFFMYEIFTAWYTQNAYEQWAFAGPNISPETLLAGFILKTVAVLLLLFKKFRSTVWLLFCAMGLPKLQM